MPHVIRLARRRTDEISTGAAVREFGARLDPIFGGRLLLVLSGCGIALGAMLLHPDEREWAMLLSVSAAMIGLLLLSLLIDWSRFPARASAAFPITLFAGFALLGVLTPQVTSALTGLLTGAYLYTGLTQPRRSSAWVVPLGCTTFVVMNGGLTSAVAVRLIIGACVWTTIVETLAFFTQQQQRLTQELTRAANLDVLTGIPNRRDLDTRLTLARPGDAIVLCDLDHFKRLNDTQGHHAGDRTLADFGALLRVHLRAEDYCARYGGEEFLLLLPDTDQASVLAVVQRLRAGWQLMAPATSFSAGVAVCRADRAVTATLAAADAALYGAKSAGRNTTRTEASSVSA